MKNVKHKEKNLSCELHSNLMLVTTIVAMLGFVALMLIFMGMKNTSLPEFTATCSKVCAVVSWISAAIIAYRSVKGKKKYYLEYIIYLLIMGFGFLFMFNMPVFLYTKFHITNWASLSLKILTAITGIYFVASVAFHGIIAGKAKK